MKKILSFILSLAILVTVFVLPTYAAEGFKHTANLAKTIDNTATFDLESFDISLVVDESKILCFDGGNVNYSYNFKSIKILSSDTASYVEYFEDPEAFAEVFNSDGFKKEGTTLYVDLELEFDSTEVFGQLEYNVVIKGFSMPLDTGLDLGGLLGGGSNVNLPVAQDITIPGSDPMFPSIDFTKTKIIGEPEKTIYSDAERFDPTGTKLEVTLTNNSTGTVTYTDKTTNFFTFSHPLNENLSVYENEVVTFLLGHPVNYTPISVSHQWSAGYVNITTYKYTATKPGYHAIVCEGCGESKDAQPHTLKNEEWTYNNDQTFVANGTESNICADCGTILTRDTFGTADFNNAFADMHFIKVIFEYINVLLRFIGAATY